MLFKFHDETVDRLYIRMILILLLPKMDGMANVLCLDACTVEVTDANWASKNTAIVLAHPERY